jgi:hypothetical protein
MSPPTFHDELNYELQKPKQYEKNCFIYRRFDADFGRGMGRWNAATEVFFLPQGWGYVA